MTKQFEILDTVLHFHKQALEAIEAGVETADIFKLTVREEIARAKYIPQSELDKIVRIKQTITEQTKALSNSQPKV
jgi:V/A-type H+-transporting ATPase subunit A